MAGQKFDTSSILNAPLLDYLIKHTASTGRPGAGPALALSLVLVAVVCAFTGLCYAELASMIPIAGSAYTYTYATMGELIAWIIGWDLILEYAVSNMAVSVGFAQHLVNMFDWFGWHPALRWISPAYLPSGMSGLQGEMLYAPGFHFGFNFPAFFVVMILTVVLVRGIRESAETNNVMVILKIAILAFVLPDRISSSGIVASVCANGWSGILTGGSIISSPTSDSIRFPPRPRRRNPQRDLPLGLSPRWLCTVFIGRAVFIGNRAVGLRADAAPVVNSLKHLTEVTGSPVLLGAPRRAFWRDDGNDFVIAGVSAWTGAGMVFHVARRPAAKAVLPRASAISHAFNGNLDRRISGGDPCGNFRYRNAFRSLEHRNPVCVRAGLAGRDYSALQGP